MNAFRGLVVVAAAVTDMFFSSAFPQAFASFEIHSPLLVPFMLLLLLLLLLPLRLLLLAFPQALPLLLLLIILSWLWCFPQDVSVFDSSLILFAFPQPSTFLF